MRKVLVVSYLHNGEKKEFEIDPRDIRKFLACMDDAIDADLSTLYVIPEYKGDNTVYEYSDWSEAW